MDQIVFLRVTQHQQQAHDAGAVLEGCVGPVYDPAQGANAQELTLAPVTQNSGHPRLDYLNILELSRVQCLTDTKSKILTPQR